MCHQTRETGTGTFGRVRLVRHFESGHYYALKISKKAAIIKMKQVTIASNLGEYQTNDRVRAVDLYTAGLYTRFMYHVSYFVWKVEHVRNEVSLLSYVDHPGIVNM